MVLSNALKSSEQEVGKVIVIDRRDGCDIATRN